MLRELQYYWLPIAQSLGVGRSARVANPLEPNARASLIIKNTPTGYSAWDFRHREGDFVFKDLIYHVGEVEEVNQVEIPEDSIPINQLEEHLRGVVERLILKMGVTSDMFRMANKSLLFSFEKRRLLIECHNEWGESFYLGRDISGRSNAKYINYRSKNTLTYDVIGIDNAKEDVLVLTEDTASALKINYSTGLTTVSLSGTMIREEVVLLATEFRKVVVWLDGDEAGVQGSKEVLRNLKGLVRGIHEVNVWGKDPKDLKIQEIKNIIGDLK